MALSDIYQQLPRTVQDALTEYGEAFSEALVLADVEDWASSLGISAESSSIKTIYPLPIYAAGYQEFSGEVKYRSLYMRHVTMRGKVWQDGVKERADIVKAADFMGWGAQPRAMALEAKRLPNTITADLLATASFAGPLLDLYKDEDDPAANVAKRLFAPDHAHNVLDASKGTFTNIDTTTTLDDTFLSKQKQAFRNIKGPNGKPLGLRMTHLLVPAALEQQARDLLESDVLIRTIENAGSPVGAVTVPNQHRGTVELIVADELQSDDYVYALALNKPGLVPWIVQTSGAPVETVLDESSDFYKTSHSIAVAHFVNANVGAAFPHPIRRIQVTGGGGGG